MNRFKSQLITLTTYHFYFEFRPKIMHRDIRGAHEWYPFQPDNDLAEPQQPAVGENSESGNSSKGVVR